jgi:chromosome segregation ATPase
MISFLLGQSTITFMSTNIAQIEKQFLTQKTRLLKGLERTEKKKRTRFSHIATELERYKKREALLRKIESETASHLRQVNAVIEKMGLQEIGDRKSMESMLKEMHRLKKEIPKLQRERKRLGPARSKALAREKAYVKRLSVVSAKVRNIERRHDLLKRELGALANKESMLRAGRIYWNSTGVKNARKARKTRPRKTAPRPTVSSQIKQKQSFLDALFKSK